MIWRRSLTCRYTAGYTRNAIVHDGVSDYGRVLLPKRSAQQQLTAKARQTIRPLSYPLHAPDGGSGVIRAIDDLPIQQSHFAFHVFNLRRRDRVGIAVPNGDVGTFARLDRSSWCRNAAPHGC